MSLYKYYLAATGNILKYLDKIKENEFLPYEGIKQLQKFHLFNLMEHSIRSVPYYKEAIPELPDFQDFDASFIKSLPLLNKDIIVKNFSNMKDVSLKEGSYYINSSGGSTGRPANFIQDRDYFEYKQAAKLLYNQWCGCSIGDKQLILWGSVRDIFSGKNSFKTNFGRWVRNEIWLNAFRITSQDMYNFVNKINSFRPKLILAYVDSIHDLAKFIEHEDLKISPPRSIMVTAGTLSPEMRKRITTVFKTEVFNRYGSREVGDIACECDHHQGLHISPTSHYVEILSKDGKEAAPGEVGEIVVTSLTNYAMPLIRYKIGDMGSWAKTPCTCGRSWPLLEKVTGRVSDVFVRKDGMQVHSGIFTFLFFHKDWIRKFQVVQEDYSKINISIVADSSPSSHSNEEKEISEKIKEIMGNDCKVEFKYVRDIPKDASGKYRYLISKLKS